MPMYEEFFGKLKEVSEIVLKNSPREILLIHHNDADGLSSAAIMTSALQNEGFEIRRICLEKLFPEVVERLHSKEKEKIFVYVDIGSAHVKRIAECNQKRNLVVILDHHDTEKCVDETIFNLNPELFGIKGETEASASIVCYLFSKILNEENIRLAYIGLIGAQELIISGTESKSSSNLVSLTLNDAEQTGQIKGGKIVKFNISLKEMFKKLQILGGVGYYRNGPEMGIKACLMGFDTTNEFTNRLEMERKMRNKRVIAMLLKGGLKKTTHIQWFHVGDMFKGMGTKVIGTFCSYLSFQRFIDSDKYIIGMMNMEKTIPGFGELEKDYVKISGRVPPELKEKIKMKRAEPLSYLLPEACKQVGGFGDGHEFAASGIIPKGKEEEFILTFDELSRT